MTLFQQSELKAAFRFAEQGGQALLMLPSHADDPQRGRLIDHDYERLFETVRRLGLKAVIADRIGEVGQSVEIRGRQLDRALAETQAMELSL